MFSCKKAIGICIFALCIVESICKLRKWIISTIPIYDFDRYVYLWNIYTINDKVRISVHLLFVQAIFFAISTIFFFPLLFWIHSTDLLSNARGNCINARSLP